jgi:hypothetical protein
MIGEEYNQKETKREPIAELGAGKRAEQQTYSKSHP